MRALDRRSMLSARTGPGSIGRNQHRAPPIRTTLGVDEAEPLDPVLVMVYHTRGSNARTQKTQRHCDHAELRVVLHI
jgi:hypothetical protein